MKGKQCNHISFSFTEGSITSRSQFQHEKYIISKKNKSTSTHKWHLANDTFFQTYRVLGFMFSKEGRDFWNTNGNQFPYWMYYDERLSTKIGKGEQICQPQSLHPVRKTSQMWQQHIFQLQVHKAPGHKCFGPSVRLPELTHSTYSSRNRLLLTFDMLLKYVKYVSHCHLNKACTITQKCDVGQQVEVLKVQHWAPPLSETNNLYSV